MPQFMKLQPASTVNLNFFTAYGDDYVCVNTIRHTSNLIVMSGKVIPAWTQNTFDTLAPEDMLQLAALDAEVILLGTGLRQRFLQPELMQTMAMASKGLETMDLHAACRTYNLLMGEGRKVAAALLFA